MFNQKFKKIIGIHNPGVTHNPRPNMICDVTQSGWITSIKTQITPPIIDGDYPVKKTAQLTARNGDLVTVVQADGICYFYDTKGGLFKTAVPTTPDKDATRKPVGPFSIIGNDVVIPTLNAEGQSGYRVLSVNSISPFEFQEIFLPKTGLPWDKKADSQSVHIAGDTLESITPLVRHLPGENVQFSHGEFPETQPITDAGRSGNLYYAVTSNGILYLNSSDIEACIFPKADHLAASSITNISGDVNSPILVQPQSCQRPDQARPGITFQELKLTIYNHETGGLKTFPTNVELREGSIDVKVLKVRETDSAIIFLTVYPMVILPDNPITNTGLSFRAFLFNKTDSKLGKSHQTGQIFGEKLTGERYDVKSIESIYSVTNSNPYPESPEDSLELGIVYTATNNHKEVQCFRTLRCTFSF